MLVLSIYSISSKSLWGAQICCNGHGDAVYGIAVCTGGVCEASELAGGGNGLLTSGATGGIGWGGSRLVGTTAGQVTFLFIVYLAPELVWTW